MPKKKASKTEKKPKIELTISEKELIFLDYRKPRETQFRIVNINMIEIFSIVRDMAVEPDVLLIELIGAAETLMASMEKKNVDKCVDMGLIYKDLMKKTFEDAMKQTASQPGNMFG